MGIQWYWGFEVQDFRKRDYTSDLASNRLSDQYICNEDYEPDLGKTKFIAHNNDSIDAPVLPQGSIARILVTRKDVIHCLGINSFGVKLDAIPGRSSATYLHATYTGTFYTKSASYHASTLYLPLIWISVTYFSAYSEEWPP